MWPDGPVCPHCTNSSNIKKLKGKSTRRGVYKCYDCRKPFTVKVGTIFESSHVPLHLWLQAIYLMCASKKGISSNQLHRVLGVTLKTAWFMSHRIREAMRVEGEQPLMGGDGKTVEADETYIGRDKTIKPRGQKKGRGYAHKYKVFSMVEREGKVRSQHVPRVNADTLRPIMLKNIAKESRLITDEAFQYIVLGRSFAEHHSVSHSKGEYVRDDIYSNTIENYFSVFKRGMKGVYQHCNEKHLQRYLAEFDFRYNERAGLGVGDEDRVVVIIKGAKGKRLKYRH